MDEFALKLLHSFEEKEFKSVSAGDLGFDRPEEEKSEPTEEQKGLPDAMTAALNGKVKAVRVSKRLKTYPVCLTSDGEVSLEMEKVLNAQPGNEQKIQAERVLEINENHPIYQKLQALRGDEALLGTYTLLLYSQALLLEGMSIEDPVAYTRELCDLLAK